MPPFVKSICLTIFTLLNLSTLTAAQSVSTLDVRRKVLNDLLAEQWDYHLRTHPLLASFFGDKRWNAELNDFSQSAIDMDLQETQRFLTRFESIDSTGFSQQELLNKRIMVRDLKMQLEGARFKPWEMPVDQQNGMHIILPQLPVLLSFKDVKDYEDYIVRLNRMPRLLDQIIILDWSPFLRQAVKTHFSLNGELSHGIVTQAVHAGV